MRRLLPPVDLSTVLAHDVDRDEPGAVAGDLELTDEQLVHEYGYPDHGRWVRANMVGSIDGVATVAGLSDGLSGAADKRVFGLLRALADVVVVGAGTARTENYRGALVSEKYAGLRASLGQQPVAPIALVSRSLGLDPTARVFTETSVRPIVLTCATAPDDRRAELTEVADVIDAGETTVDLAAALDALEARGLRRILCEGGPTLLHDLVGEALLDELCLTTSPRLVGGGERHVLNGAPLNPPPGARLVGLLEDDHVLFSRYVLETR
jgi:riboflavin biosynthesis pyrimidine reductase